VNTNKLRLFGFIFAGIFVFCAVVAGVILITNNQQDDVEAAVSRLYQSRVSSGGGTGSYVIVNSQIWYWGGGALGLGQQFFPVRVGTASNWVSICSATERTFAINSAGQLWGWGANFQGEIGDGTQSTRHEPIRIGTRSDWTQVSGGATVTAGITADGGLWVWGSRGHGAIGEGSQVGNQLVPLRIRPDLHWAQVSAGASSVLARTTSGQLWGWGRNNNGQLGDGTTVQRNVPVRIGVRTDWRKVVASSHSDNSFAITTGGELWGWGNNSRGQIGDGSTIRRLAPVRIGAASNWARVAASGNTSMIGGGPIDASSGSTFAINDAGQLWAWGANNVGQLGDGTTIQRHAPVRIGSRSDWIDVSAGNRASNNHANTAWVASVGMTANGQVWSWGTNLSGALGNGTGSANANDAGFRASPDLVHIPPPTASVRFYRSDTGAHIGTVTRTNAPGIEETFVTPAFTGAVLPGQAFLGWNIPYVRRIMPLTSGTLAPQIVTPVFYGTVIGVIPPDPNPSPENWESGWNILRLHFGAGNASGVPLPGFDLNENGSTATRFYNPTNLASRQLPTAAQMNTWAESEPSLTNHRFLGWYTNPNWNVAAGQRVTQIPAGLTGVLRYYARWTNQWVVSQVSGNLALTQCGELLHLWSSVSRAAPANDWAQISMAWGSNFAITASGQLWAWGDNSFGQLGDGTTITRNSPVRIGTRSDWAYVAAGTGRTFAITTGGQLWAWGFNGNGHLADGTTINRHAPVRVGTRSDWAQISVTVAATLGWGHIVALTSSGAVYTWGTNESGQLGTGSSGADQTTPLRVGNRTDWAFVNTSASRSIAITTNGELWAWGNTIGDGTTWARIPTRIGDRNDWVQISSGQLHTFAMTANGELWAWGHNHNGQLGDGTTTNRWAPVRIASHSNWVQVSASNSGGFAISTTNELWSWDSHHNGSGTSPVRVDLTIR